MVGKCVGIIVGLGITGRPTL